MTDADSMINDCLRENGYDLAGGTNVSDSKETPILKKIATDLVYMFFQQSRNVRNRDVTDNVPGFWSSTPELTPTHRNLLRKMAKRLNGNTPAYNYSLNYGLH